MEVAFTSKQAPGAIPNGAVVEKVNSEPGDDHTNGARATVVGSWGPIDDDRLPDRYFYFVEWEDRPGIPVGVSGNRIQVPSRQNGQEETALGGKIRKQFDEKLGLPVHEESVGPTTACVYQIRDVYRVIMMGDKAAAVDPQEYASLDQAKAVIADIRVTTATPAFREQVEQIQRHMDKDR